MALAPADSSTLTGRSDDAPRDTAQSRSMGSRRSVAFGRGTRGFSEVTWQPAAQRRREALPRGHRDRARGERVRPFLYREGEEAGIVVLNSSRTEGTWENTSEPAAPLDVFGSSSIETDHRALDSSTRIPIPQAPVLSGRMSSFRHTSIGPA